MVARATHSRAPDSSPDTASAVERAGPSLATVRPVMALERESNGAGRVERASGAATGRTMELGAGRRIGFVTDPSRGRCLLTAGVAG